MSSTTAGASAATTTIAASTPHTLDPFAALRTMQLAASCVHRTPEQMTTFASEFNPTRFPEDSIVIPETVTRRLGLGPLTQGMYANMMTGRFVVSTVMSSTGPIRSMYIPNVTSSVSLRGHIISTGDTTTRYENLASFTDTAGTTYTLGHRLGAGKYGVVHELTSHPDRVVKIMIGDNVSDDGDLLLETFIQLIVSAKLKTLRAEIGDDKFVGHYADAAGVYSLCAFRTALPAGAPGAVTGITGATGNRYILLVMDKAATPFGNYIKGSMTPLQRTTVNAHVTYQISRTLEYLIRELGFNHRDLKCDNIMVTPVPSKVNSNGVVLMQASLIDFGMSRIVYNNRLFSSNWGIFMPALKDDIYPRPDHDIMFFLLSMIWQDGCGLDFDRTTSCATHVLPEFYKGVIGLLIDSHPEIKAKYTSNLYSGTNAAGTPRWWEFYKDTFNAINSVTIHESRSGLRRIVVDFLFNGRVQEFMKDTLRRIAHNPATAHGPLYFGRRK